MTYARVLFTVGAVFNIAVALGLTITWPLTQELLQLGASEGSNALVREICAVIVLTFGYAYFMVGQNPVRYREYVTLGIIGKLLVVAVAIPVLGAGSEGVLLAALALGDLLFALLFADFLRRTPQA